MGQPVTLIRTASPRPGIVRFELNRSLTGMGHERYDADTEITGDRPPDRLAKRLFDAGGVASVHIYGSMVTAQLSDPGSSDTESSDTESSNTDWADLERAVQGLYTYYVPGVEIPSDDELTSLVEG